MDEKDITDNLLIELYLQDKLSDEEAASFEERFLSSPELLDGLESAELLGQGLKQIAAIEKANMRGSQRQREKPANKVVSLFQSPRYAMAASFLLLVSLGYSGILFQMNKRLGEVESGLAVSSEIIPMVSVRGTERGEPVNTLQLGDSQQQFVLMLDPGYELYDHFRATVFRSNSTDQPAQLWQVDNLTPGFEDMLALGLPGSALEPGDYEVRLEGWRDEWSVNHAYDPIKTVSFSCVKK